MGKRVTDFLKRETVLSAAAVLAVISCFLVRPDREYLGYVDLRTLILLFCLMAVMDNCLPVSSMAHSFTTCTLHTPGHTGLPGKCPR